MNVKLPIILAAIAMTGCAALEEAADFSLQSTCDQTIKTVDGFFSENPGIDEDFKTAIIESRVMNGMTKDMVAASWGSKADKIVLTGHTTWQWQDREPKGEWVNFKNARVIDASSYSAMFFSNYKRCTQ